MRPTSLILAGWRLGQPALVADTAEIVARGMAERAPEGWQVRMRWRDDALVAFATGPTVQASFDLYYDTRAQAELVTRLCPPAADPVWRQLQAHQDIAIEPEVMGKGGLRVSCRAVVGAAPAT